MECTSMNWMKHPVTRMWLKYPCGQCLACRVKKQSAYTLRNLLECRTAASKQFWTLTFDDQNLHELGRHGPRKMSRRFFDALRKSEHRHGNSRPVRYFGCFELGGTLGRPHYHFLIYNLERNILPIYTSLQRSMNGQQHIGLWPYGHIDVGTVTKQSIRYTSSYITNFEKDPSAALAIRTTRPAIGYFGLEQLLENIAKKSTTLPRVPDYITMDGRDYPLDTWTRRKFEEIWKQKHNGKFTEAVDPYERKLQALSLDAAKAEVGHHQRNREKVRKMETQMEIANAKKAKQEAIVERRYRKITSEGKGFDIIETFRASDPNKTISRQVISDDWREFSKRTGEDQPE